jgi:hypothetical protein
MFANPVPTSLKSNNNAKRKRSVPALEMRENDCYFKTDKCTAYIRCEHEKPPTFTITIIAVNI